MDTVILVYLHANIVENQKKSQKKTEKNKRLEPQSRKKKQKIFKTSLNTLFITVYPE